VYSTGKCGQDVDQSSTISQPVFHSRYRGPTLLASFRNQGTRLKGDQGRGVVLKKTEIRGRLELNCTELSARTLTHQSGDLPIVTPALQELHRLPVTERLQYKLCLLVHKSLLEHMPEYIFWHLLPIFQVDLHYAPHRVATSSCRGHVDELATEPFLLLHREHRTGYRRSWNCCDRWTRFVVIWKHFCLILFTGTRIQIDSRLCDAPSVF